MIVPLTPAAGLDPAATGSWVIRRRPSRRRRSSAPRRPPPLQEAAAQETGAIHWPDPNQQGGYQGPYEDTSHATAQWNFTEALGETAAAPEGAQAPWGGRRLGPHG